MNTETKKTDTGTGKEKQWEKHAGRVVLVGLYVLLVWAIGSGLSSWVELFKSFGGCSA